MRKTKVLGSFVVVALALCASGKAEREGKEVVCKTCNDTGRVETQCPVCRGTKYIWRCLQGHDPCGYGASYKPLCNCRSTRKRIPCSNCLGKGKTSATGKVTVACPDCDGQGTLVKTYYLVRDARNLEYNREYIVRQLEQGRECSYTQRRKMTEEELADYKIENSNCKVFESEDELMAFLKNGEEQKTGAKWYFAVRDAKNVTMYDKRRALEDMARGGCYSYSDSNVLKRKFTDEEVKDFKALNPNCKLFRDVDEFKEFMRNVKSVDAGASVVRHWSGDGSEGGSRIVITNGTRRFFRTRGSSYGRESQQQPQLSPEELKKIIDAENAHDKEMFERKFGKEGLKHINNQVE